MSPELKPDGRVHVAFSGLPAREGPLAVGQRNVLQWLGKAGTAGIAVNRWIFDLPPGRTVDEIRAAFAHLLADNEALRTTVDLDGDPRQRVAADGSLPIELFTTDPEADETAAAERLAVKLRALPFDLARELPLRVGLIVIGEVVRAAVMVYTHMALDVGGAALIGRQLTRLLTEPDEAGEAASRWQPLDRVAWELSPRGRRQLQAALDYWEQQLRTVPHCMYALPVQNGRPQPGDWAPEGATAAARRAPAIELKSPAAAIALPHIAARTGTSPTMVAVAAFVAVLAHRTGHPRCAYISLVGNRIGRHLHGYVGTLAGPSLVTVEADAYGFDELVRRTGSATLTAARHAVVDVGALNELSQAVYHERGVAFARDVVVNNIHHALGNNTVPAQPPPLSGLPAAAGQTTMKWTEWERVPQLLNFRIFRLDETALTFRLSTASVKSVPAAELERLARGVESLLLAAAAGDVGMTTLSAVTGVEPGRRGQGWAYLDGCWVELAQVRRLVADSLAPAVTSVFLEPAAQRAPGRLTAYLAGDITPAEAHGRCVAALPGPAGLEYYSYITVTPHRYVVCAQAPADVHDHDAWRRQPVVAEGDGRGHG